MKKEYVEMMPQVDIVGKVEGRGELKGKFLYMNQKLKVWNSHPVSFHRCIQVRFKNNYSDCVKILEWCVEFKREPMTPKRNSKILSFGTQITVASRTRKY